MDNQYTFGEFATRQLVLSKGSVTEGAQRRYSGHSKDHRPDLPQIVICIAVAREGILVRVWSFPGDTSDQVLICKVKDDLRSWGLNRVIRVLDRGFTSAQNRRYLQRGSGHYIMGKKLRSDQPEAKAALSRQGRYHVARNSGRHHRFSWSRLFAHVPKHSSDTP